MYSPELFAELAGDSGNARQNCRSLEAEGRGCLGGKREESLAFITAWSRRGINAALRRIDVGV